MIFGVNLRRKEAGCLLLRRKKEDSCLLKLSETEIDCSGG